MGTPAWDVFCPVLRWHCCTAHWDPDMCPERKVCWQQGKSAAWSYLQRATTTAASSRSDCSMPASSHSRTSSLQAPQACRQVHSL